MKITIQKLLQYLFCIKEYEVEDVKTHRKEKAISYYLFGIFSKTIYKSI